MQMKLVRKQIPNFTRNNVDTLINAFRHNLDSHYSKSIRILPLSALSTNDKCFQYVQR